MKSLIFALAIISSTAFANSGATICSDNEGGPDHGLAAVISADNTRADIIKVTIAGTETIATLKCLAPKTQPPTCCDQFTTVLICNNLTSPDNGLILTVTTGGLAGREMATLENETIAGPQHMASMLCRDLNGKK